MMSDLQRLLAAQDFKSDADMRKFMDGLIGKEVPSFSKDMLSDQQQAQDLVFEAYELPPAKAKQRIEMALQLDRNCIEAYEFLASKESVAEIAAVFYEKGIAIGRTIFGGKYLKEHKGSFWGFHETRPFMRCLQHYSDCLYVMGDVEECVAILEEMIVLNKNDNQGVRDQLMLYLIELNERKKFLKYANMFGESEMAFSLFNHALFAFKTEGETDAANKKLQKAVKQNKFVAAGLLSKKGVENLPGHHGFGDKNEADYYVYFAQHIWMETDGALAWLKKYAVKS